jgi:O-antigen/teichoic acid export membrane protein
MQTVDRVVPTPPAARSGRSLTGRASLNAVASGLDYGTRAVVELVVSPLVVSGLGAAAFGAWRVLWQWSSYVWGASGRSAQALQFAVANRQWTAGPREKRELVGAAVVVWACFLPLMLVVGGLGVWAAPLVLDVPAGQELGVRLAALVLLVDAVLVTLVTLPRSALQGENLGYTRMGASAAMVAIGGVLMAGAATGGLGLPGLAGAAVATTLLTGSLFWVITRRRLAWFGIARPSRAVVRWFLGLSAWFLGWKFVLELMIASDVLILAMFAPLAAVAAFALTKWVADSLAQVLGLLVQATIPGIGGYVGSGDLRRAAALRGEVLALVWLVGTAVGATVIAWNATFVSVWVGPHLFAGHTTTLLLLVLTFQIALIRTDTFIIDVALIPRVKVVAGVVAAVASITLAVLAVGPLDAGVVGLCAGLVIGRAVLGVAAPVAVGRHLGIPFHRQLTGLVRPALTTLATFAAASWLARQEAAESWLVLLLGVAATVPVVGAVSFVTGLNAVQRRRLWRRARLAFDGSRPSGGAA